MSQTRRQWPTWLTSLLIFGAVLLVFAPVTQFEFLPYWDDGVNILQNPLYRNLSPHSFAQFWLQPYQNLYIPVTYSAWAFLVTLSNGITGSNVLEPAIFHAANLLIHAATAALAFLLLLLLLQFFDRNKLPDWRLQTAAAAGTLFFAFHPLQVEAVAWVSGFRDVLGTFFAGLTLLLYVTSVGQKKASARQFYYAVASVAYLLALGAKPGMVAIPAVAFILGLWPLRHSKRTLAFTIIPWLIIGVVWTVLTIRAQTAAALARDLVPLWVRPLVALDALAFYVAKIFWPFNLSADYGRAPNLVFQSGALYWTALFPVALVVVLTFFRRTRWLIFSFAIFTVALAPTLGLVPFNFQIVSTVADRYGCFALLGPALALAFVTLRLPRKILPLASVVVFSMAALTVARLPDWLDLRHLFKATLAVNPRSWKAHENYGCILDNMGESQEALGHLQESIRLWPSGFEAWNDIAPIYVHLGRLNEAITAYENSLKLRYNPATARNLAIAYFQADQPLMAIKSFKQLYNFDPTNLEVARQLAWFLATYPDDAVRNGPESLQLARQVIQAHSASIGQEWVTLAAAAAESGDIPQATEAARTAIQIFQNQGQTGGVDFVNQQILPTVSRGDKIRDNSLLHPIEAEVGLALRHKK